MDIVGNSEHGWFIGLGMYRLTDFMETKEDCIEYLDSNMWELIISITTATCIAHEKQQAVEALPKVGV